MIGNDIIDIKLAQLQSNWRRKGYLKKITTVDEQAEIFSSEHQNTTFWLLWSMKEAVYKIVHRQTKNRSYNPLQLHTEINVQNEAFFEGAVSFNDTTYRTKSYVHKEYIHTIAAINIEKLSNVQLVIQDASNYTSQDLGKILLNTTSVKVYKDNYQIPYLINCETGEKIAVSISHHGRFISMICNKPDEFL